MAVDISIESTSPGLSSRVTNSYFIAYFRRNPLQAFGLIYMIIAVILAIIGPFIVPHSPTTPNPDARLLPPSSEYWFGTDANGMCVLSRAIAAFRTDLLIALCGALLALILGAPTGIFAGYFDGKKGAYGVLSTIILRIMDIIQAFPTFVLALALVAILGPKPENLIMLIAFTNLPGNLRLARTEVLAIRERLFVESARASGNSELRIAFGHIMPNAMTQVIALLSLVMGFGILLTAGLSFVGAGVRIPTPEWGLMIATGAPTMITGEWWPAVFPGFIMALTVFAFSMLGEGITAFLDPLERVRLGFH